MSKPSLNDYEWAHELFEDLIRYQTALQKIADWEMPPTNKFWPDGKEIRYSYLYGSQGERDYIRSVALDALRKS